MVNAPAFSRLIVRLPNWVGDVCMALPAIALLHEAGIPLTLVGRGWIRDLLAGCDLPLAALPKGVFAAAKTLRTLDARDALLFTNSFGSAFAMRWAGLSATGYRHECRSLLLGQSLHKIPGIHESEAFWRLAQAVLARRGLSPGPALPPDAHLPLHPRHHDEATAALAKAGIRGKYFLLCPFATGTIKGRSKAWPAFPLLCRMLMDQGATVLACPGPGEEAACAAALPGATSIPGLGLGAYAVLMAQAQQVVANDSGPMHLAAAVDASVLGIFGLTDPQRTRPWSQRAKIIGDARGFPAIQTVWKAMQS